MYQRKDKSDRIAPGCHEGVFDLFRLLESSDPKEVESVKNMIHENLSTVKDSRLLNCIVDYWMALHSERSLDILVRVKDPHDKHLFDKINELMKSEDTCYQSLQLLCNLVYKQPSWIHKIANHRLIHSLFHLLKNDVHAPNLVSALLIILCLLPMIPSRFGPSLLHDTFEVFSRLISWNVKKPSAIPETFVLHLQVGIYSLFHRLYGMFPCNFLAYLRSYYGGKDYNAENYRVFQLFIKPMLERVRLHPLLVTASKETELSACRWKKMEYHDVISECGSISLDAIEGTLEGLRGRNQNLNTVPRRTGNLFAQNLQYGSLSSQGSVTSVTMEPGSLVNEAISSHRDSLWSPSHVYGTAPQDSSNVVSPLSSKNDPEAKHLSSQLPEEHVSLDFAVEAKAEDLKEEGACNVKQKLMKTVSKDSTSDFKLCSEESDKVEPVSQRDDPAKTTERFCKEVSSSEFMDTSLGKEILQGMEAKEEDIDKEVSELTAVQYKSAEESSGEVRHDTPFCFTTQNLTDEPSNLQTAPILGKSEILIKSHDEDADEMYNSMQDAEDDPYVPTYSRYRFISQCGPPPIIPSDSIKKPNVTRSVSCPANFCSSQSHPAPDTGCASESVSKTDAVVTTCSSDVITTASAFVSIANNVLSFTSRNINYEHLIPMAMDPLPDIYRATHTSLESNYHSYNSLFTSLSPPELLDNYIQLGNVTYMNQLSLIPITSMKSTDWTHFGGKPPPDEVDILRKQILLFHNQLLFERHRKDVHSERIRRILGRAKKSKMQEELIIALKEQINLLERDNEDLKYELSSRTKFFEEYKSKKKQIEEDLNSLIIKVKVENSQLQFSNKKLQSLLVTQKEENDQIITDSKLYQEKILDLESELRLCQQEVECYRKLKRESEFLSKQLFLLQEINQLYKEKLERLKDPSDPNIGDNIMKEAAFIEINDLKMRLESTCFHLDAAKSKNGELEQLLNNMKLKQKEQHEINEGIKSLHQDETKVHDKQLTEQKKIAIVKDSYILELLAKKDILAEKLKTMEKKLYGASNVSKTSCDISASKEGQATCSSGCTQDTNNSGQS